jgi:hypothetical protein
MMSMSMMTNHCRFDGAFEEWKLQQVCCDHSLELLSSRLECWNMILAVLGSTNHWLKTILIGVGR